MDKSIFSKEWIENFKIVFGDEAEDIIDKIDYDKVFLMDILAGQIAHLDKLLAFGHVTKQIENKEYKTVAESYYKRLLVYSLLDEVMNLTNNPNQVL